MLLRKESDARRRSRGGQGFRTLAGGAAAAKGFGRSPAEPRRPRVSDARRRSRGGQGFRTLAGGAAAAKGFGRSPAEPRRPRVSDARRRSRGGQGFRTLAGGAWLAGRWLGRSPQTMPWAPPSDAVRRSLHRQEQCRHRCTPQPVIGRTTSASHAERAAARPRRQPLLRRPSAMLKSRPLWLRRGRIVGLVQRFAKPPGGVTCLEGSNPSLSASSSASRHSGARP